MKTIQSTLNEMRQRFREAQLDTPDLDARLLLQAVTGLKQEEILLNNNKLLSDIECNTLNKFTQKRLKHEPVSRILGKRAFWRSEFKVSRETLDPRADSETIIESALRYVDKAAPLRLLDMGAGTGCLLLSLLQELPHAMGIGVDISVGAVRTAQENAQALHLTDRAQFKAADWAEVGNEKPFDVIISNPPYIPADDIAELEPEVREYDPFLALSGGKDGLDCYRSIADLLPRLLAPEGHVFLEIGATQGAAVKDILAGRGFRVLEIAQDLGGRDRCVVAKRTVYG